MKKTIIALLLLCSITVGAVDKTIENGGKITITGTNTEEVIFFTREGILGCNVATVIVVSSNAAGVAITSGLASPADWTTIQRKSSTSTPTTITFCVSSVNPKQAAIPIRIYGTAGDIVTISY